MLTAQFIKEKALEYGADLVGIGDIRHFEGTHPQRDPRSILPDATCVIGFGFRVPRALYRVMESKVQFFNYTQLGVKLIDEELSEVFLLKMGALIENEGYDACLQRNVSNLKIKGDHTTNPELVDPMNWNMWKPWRRENRSRTSSWILQRRHESAVSPPSVAEAMPSRRNSGRSSVLSLS